MIALDHLVVTAGMLAAGAAHVEQVLGVAPSGGGPHEAMGTHNRLLSLGPDAYLEVIAVDPDADPPGRPRWFRLDERAGPPALTNWAVRTDDLDAVLAGAEDRFGRRMDLARGRYRWRMGVPDDGALPFDDLAPAVLQWVGDRPAPDLPESGCRLVRLEVRHPDVRALADALPGLDRLGEVAFAQGAPALAAVIDTPTGQVRLS